MCLFEQMDLGAAITVQLSMVCRSIASSSMKFWDNPPLFSWSSLLRAARNERSSRLRVTDGSFIFLATKQ